MQSRSAGAAARCDRPERCGWFDGHAPVAALLLRWQEAGRHDDFTAAVAAVLPDVEQVAAATLRRRGVRDPAAVDDAVALVLDHLRRLPGRIGGAGPDEPPVAKFSIARAAVGHGAADDPGRVYARQVARCRALDVARSRRRTRIVSLSQVSGADERSLGHAADAAGCERLTALAAGLRAAAHLLEPRQRAIVEMLLDGKSQAVIAHVLGVCEGTVSRRRAKALAALRRILEAGA